MEATVRHIFPQPKKSNNRVFFVAAALLLILIFTRCGSGGSVKFKPSKNDTVVTTCLFVTPPQFKLDIDYMQKIYTDSSVVTKVDSSNGTKEIAIIRDSFYLHTVEVGKLKNSMGKDSLDTRGLPIMETKTFVYPKEFVWLDLGKDPSKVWADYLRKTNQIK